MYRFDNCCIMKDKVTHFVLANVKEEDKDPYKCVIIYLDNGGQVKIQANAEEVFEAMCKGDKDD